MATLHNLPQSKNVSAALEAIRAAGGIVRTKEALALGVHPRTLYELRDSGQIEQLSRGLFRLADAEPLSQPDLVTVALKIPQGVVCLISALAWHGLTTQIPHAVHVAIPRDITTPRIDYPPIKTYRFDRDVYSQGIEAHRLDGVDVRIYDREKTLADCFKHRSKVGLDTCLEGIRLYREQKPVAGDRLLKYAQICRVQRIMQPYLEALL